MMLKQQSKVTGNPRDKKGMSNPNYYEGLKSLIMNEELPFNDPEFQEKWKEWLAYRAEKRLPAYKPIGLKKTLNRLKNESGNNVTEAIDMLEYSMEQNWQGIFKRKKNGTHQQPVTSAKRAGKNDGANELVEDLRASFNNQRS